MWALCANVGVGGKFVNHIMAGDIIVGINSQSTKGWKYQTIMDRIRRTRSRPVVLHFQRIVAEGKTSAHYREVLAKWGAPRLKEAIPGTPLSPDGAENHHPDHGHRAAIGEPRGPGDTHLPDAQVATALQPGAISAAVCDLSPPQAVGSARRGARTSYN